MSEMQMSQQAGWVCPRCGNVYAPWVWQCDRCNATRNVPFVSGVCSNDDAIQFPQTTTTSTGGATVTQRIPKVNVSTGGETVEYEEITHQVHVDPNTQCVDCRYGYLVYTPDGLDCSVKCDLFGVMRSIQDTCVQQKVDIRDMKATKGDN